METMLAVVDNGIVTNVLVVDPSDQATIDHFGGLVLPQNSPVGIGFTYDGTNFSAPVTTQVVIPLPVQAKAALDKSDITMLRCIENGVAVPASWSSYRKALRDISNGTDVVSLTLPSVPAFPSGT